MAASQAASSNCGRADARCRRNPTRRASAEALARGHVSTAVRGKLQLEKGSSAARQATALAAKGHDVEIVPMTSGLGFLVRRDAGWIGAADPRRDGVALGW